MRGHPTQGPWHRPHLLKLTKAGRASEVLWPDLGPNQVPISMSQAHPCLSGSPLSPLGRLSPSAFAHTVPPASSPLPPPWVCLSLVCLLQEALPDHPAHGNSCLPQHVAKINLGFDDTLSHHLQSKLYFTRHFSCPQSHWNLTGTLLGQIVLALLLQMGTQEVRKGPELMWGYNLTNG